MATDTKLFRIYLLSRKLASTNTKGKIVTKEHPKPIEKLPQFHCACQNTHQSILRDGGDKDSQTMEILRRN